MTQREQQIEDLIQRSIYYRGVVIYKCILLEKEIELYIANHFTTDINKFLDIAEVVIDRMFFDAKISVLEELIKRKEPSINFDRVYGKLFSELRYLKDVRNKFAHYIIDLAFPEHEKIPKEFSLVNYRNGADSKPFTKGDFELFNDRMKKCMELLIKMNPY